jgi:hypothetical protein
MAKVDATQSRSRHGVIRPASTTGRTAPVIRLMLRSQVAWSIVRSNSEAQTFTAEPRAAILHQNELESSPRILSIVKASITTSYIPSTSHPPSLHPIFCRLQSLTQRLSHTSTMLSSRLSRTVSNGISNHDPPFSDLIIVFAACGFGGATHTRRLQGPRHVCARLR